MSFDGIERQHLPAWRAYGRVATVRARAQAADRGRRSVATLAPSDREPTTMSRPDSPIGTLFDIQRTATRQAEQALKQGMQTQQTAGRLLLGGLRLQETAQRQGLEVAQAATTSSMETMNVLLGGTGPTGQRRTVGELFGQLKAANREFYDAADRELQRSIESFADLSGEYYEALDRQTDQLFDALETLEDQSVEGFDEFNRQLREQLERTQQLQEEMEDQFEEQAEEAEQLLQRQAEQAEEFQQELERQGERMRQQMEQQAGRTQQMARTTQEAGAPGRAGALPDLTEIDGIGSATREELQDAGIETVEDLARADPSVVADSTATSEERAAEWIEEANELVGTTA
jgi:predicted flap endonuclease-1-like 5' DNA nuclease